MTNKNQESLSAMLDNELSNSELNQAFDEAKQDQDSHQRFGRYALIGDVLRKEQELVADESFVAGIQAALENIELPTSDQMIDQLDDVQGDNVASIASHPKWHQRINQSLSNFSQRKSVKGGAQFAIAASVAVMAVFGVSNLDNSSGKPISPVLNPVPLVQGLSPVSTDGLKQKPSANQVTQSRINALMADHNQQLRVAEPKSDKDIDEDKDSIE